MAPWVLAITLVLPPAQTEARPDGDAAAEERASESARASEVSESARASEVSEVWDRQSWTAGANAGYGQVQDGAAVALSAFVDRYVASGVAFGLAVSNRVLLDPARATRTRLSFPTNILRGSLVVRYVFVRARAFSPFMFVGVGPSWLNRGGGVVGHWEAGPGVYIHAVRRVFVELGVTFGGMFPGARCEAALGGSVFADACTFEWTPRLGIVVPFGAKSPP